MFGCKKKIKIKIKIDRKCEKRKNRKEKKKSKVDKLFLYFTSNSFYFKLNSYRDSIPS